MSDFATSLRVIAAYKAGEDLAERLATAVNVQRSMSDALNNAATEIERLQNELYAKNDEKHGVADTNRVTLTAEEREAIDGMACYFDARASLTMQSWGSLLRILLERLK